MNEVHGQRASSQTGRPTIRRPSNAGPGDTGLSGPDLLLFFVIVAVAFVVRLAYLYEARSVVFFELPISDGRAYDAWARRIAAGDWLGEGVFYQAPLYPYFLALVQLLVGHDLWAIRVIQIALGGVSCGLVFLAGRAFFSRGVGAAAGLMLALYPPAIYFDGLIQKTGIGLLWTALMLWLLGRSQRRPGAGRWAAAGVAAGLLILTRENALLLVLVIAAWLLVRFADRPARARMRWLAALAAGLAATLLPVGLRNLLVGGQFALTTSQAGPNFYIGNNPDANGSYSPLRPGRSDTPQERTDAAELAERALGRPLTPREVSHYWFGRAWDFIRHQPLDWLRLMGFKCLLVVNAYEIPDAEDIYYYEQHCSLLRALGLVGHFGVLGPLAVAGVVMTWPRRRDLWLLYVLAAAIAAGVVVFFIFARYRFPMVPVLVLFAAAALVHTPAALRSRRVRLPAVAAITALAATIAVNWPIYSKQKQLGVSYTNAGVALADSGRLAEAIEQYRTALRLQPGWAETHFNLGNALRQTHRLEEAVEHLRTAARLSPDDPEIALYLGNALAEADELAAAAEQFRRALGLRPDYVDAWQNLGVVLARDRQWGAGIAALRSGLEHAPNHVGLSGILAWLLATCPDAAWRDGATAVRLGEFACRATRWDDPRYLDILAAALAEAGRFEEAAAIADRALQRAAALGSGELARDIRARLKQYEAGKAVQQPW